MRFASALAFVLLLVLSNSPALASSYVKTDSSIVDPILKTMDSGGGVHPYTGPNLAPGAVLPNANLNSANLTSADLTGALLGGALLGGVDLSNANLTGADLRDADLPFADLTSADLSGANLRFAVLGGADLSSADLSNATDLWRTFGFAYYNGLTNFTGTGFDPVFAGWILPEPSTATLFTVGVLLGLTQRRRVRG